MSGRWKAVLLLLLVMTAFGMQEPAIGNYRFPMNGSEFLLSGTFGELRGNHFHSGIDIKTGGEIGKHLYAVREGYIYRIKVSPYGFGKAIYLRHPDGEFTVYGHMSGFNEKISEYVYQKQYASKRYEQEIYLPENQMRVSKGQFIGYSGNSGSSQGPHLHFEIRDPDERITNVLKHYKYAIRDDVNPILKTIGLQPLEASSLVKGQFDKLELVPEGSNGRYSIPGVVDIKGKVGLEYHAYDLLSGAHNHCGINYTKLFLDGNLIFEFQMDSYSFDEKKYINVHIDYPYYKKHKKKFQRAYVENGNKLDCYKNLSNRGVLELFDDRVHDLRLEMRDTHLNNTTLRMKIRRSATANLPVNLDFPGLTTLRGETIRNVFVCKVKNPSTAHLRGLDVVYNNGDQSKLKPAYLQGAELVYLLSLDKWRLPEQVKDPLTGKSIDFFLRETILPDKNNIVEYEELQCYFPYTAVFDSLPLHIRKYPGNASMYSDVYEIGTTNQPLFKSFVLNFRPRRNAKPLHAVVARKNRAGHWVYLGKEINEDGSIYASSGNFGTFCVMADSISPRIKPLNFNDGGAVSGGQRSLRLKLTDNFAGIDNRRIHCTIDNNWVLFEFDGKTSTIRHELRDRPRPGRHRLHVMVYDNANNLQEKWFNLNF